MLWESQNEYFNEYLRRAKGFAGFRETVFLLLWIPAPFCTVLGRLFFKIICHCGTTSPAPLLIDRSCKINSILNFREKGKIFFFLNLKRLSSLPPMLARAATATGTAFSAPPADTYHSSVSNEPIIYTQPDRKLGILCMKYFAGAWGVNRLLNEASLPGRVMKISDEQENYCIMTCRGTFTHAHTHTHTHVQGGAAVLVTDFRFLSVTLQSLPH